MLILQNNGTKKGSIMSQHNDEFDNAYNDSLIIANYTSATVGKRKFKSCRPGYVIPFEITAGALSGKRGLIKIISINGQDTGFMEFALKIQQ